MTPLETIRIACIKANPRIKDFPPYPYNPDAERAVVELERIVSQINMLTSSFEKKEEIKATATMYMKNYEEQKMSDYIAMLRHEYEPRPIMLADVLLAIMRKKMSEIKNFNSVPGGVTVPVIQAETIAYMWLLNKDDLSLQTPETLSFIADLLK